MSEMLPRDLQDILDAFPEAMRDEAREVLEHWDDYGFCAYAQLAGMADRPEVRFADSVRIHAMLRRAHPDGFARQYADLFGVSLDEAHAEGVRAVAEARRMF